jgi:transcriptional regulator with XRE-family HTH domain
MKTCEKDFVAELGRRITQFRKDRNMTQAELAAMLALKQQALASYEVGRRRVPVSMLPKVAQILGVAVEELLGVSNETRKRGPPPKIQRLIEEVHRLPKPRQKFVVEMLENALQVR